MKHLSGIIKKYARDKGFIVAADGATFAFTSADITWGEILSAGDKVEFLSDPPRVLLIRKWAEKVEPPPIEIFPEVAEPEEKETVIESFSFKEYSLVISYFKNEYIGTLKFYSGPTDVIKSSSLSSIRRALSSLAGEITKVKKSESKMPKVLKEKPIGRWKSPFNPEYE